MSCTDLQVFETFEVLEKITQKKLKLEELEKLKNCKILHRIFELVYDKQIVFNVGEALLSKIRCGNKHVTSFTEFENKVVKPLLTHHFGQKDLLKLLNAFFIKTSPLSCKWYKRILLKDLRIGVGRELLKILYAGKNTRITMPSDTNIQVMLGQEFHKFFTEKQRDLVAFFKQCKEWYIEPKIDGIRAVTLVYPDGSFKCLSRNSKPLPNLELLIENDIKKLHERLKVHYKNGFVLDGEVYGKNWNDTMTKLFTRKNVDPNQLKKAGVKYYVFDLLNLKAFLTASKTEPLRDRKKKLIKFINNLTYIKVVPFKILRMYNMNSEKLAKYLNYLLDKALKLNYEGIVIKCADASYEYKRSNYMIKLKKFYTDDFVVIDVDKKGKVPGQAGAIIIDVDGVPTRVGSGLTDELKKCIYNHPEDIIGEYVEIAYQEKTDKGKLRFPRLIRIRLDKSPFKDKEYKCLLDAIKKM